MKIDSVRAAVAVAGGECAPAAGGERNVDAPARWSACVVDGFKNRSARVQEELCFFFVRFTLSRLRTCSSVCELSRIFMYAASVSWIVLSYSFRAWTFRARLSLIFESRSVRIDRSF